MPAPTRSSRVALGARELVDDPGGRHERHDPNWQVDEEDPAPRPAGEVIADDEAADQWAGNGGDPDDCAQVPEDARPLVRRECDLHDAEHLWVHQRSHPALEDAGEVEHQRALCQPAERRCQHESTHAHHQETLASVDVTETSTGDKGHRIGESVACDDELDVGVVGRKIGPDGGNGHTHDGDVEQRHEEGGQHGGECDPSAGIGSLAPGLTGVGGRRCVELAGRGRGERAHAPSPGTRCIS